MNVYGLPLPVFLSVLLMLCLSLLSGLFSWQLATVLICITLLTVLGWLAGRIFRPLYILRLALDNINQVDSVEIIPGIARRDELGALARGIHTLREERRVQAHTRHLHHLVTTLLPAGLLLQEGRGSGLLQGDAHKPGGTDSRHFASELARIQQSVEKIMLFTQDIYESFLSLRGQIQAITSRSDAASRSIATTAVSVGMINTRLTDVNRHLHAMERSMERVTLAVHEMTDAFGDIQQLTVQAADESVNASQLSQNVRTGIEQLSRSVMAISQVVAGIDTIAEQTNILALNAAIEAAGAGVFGTGFAVVAKEVKELASQTSQATQTITDRIKEIQTMADASLAVTEQASTTMVQLSSTNREIAQRIIAQNAATRLILESMQETSRNTAKILEDSGRLGASAQDVASAAKSSAMLTQEIADASQCAYTASEQVAQQSDAIGDLSKMAMTFVSKTRQAVESVSQHTDDKPEETRNAVGSPVHFTALGGMVRRLSDAVSLSPGGTPVGSEPFDVQRMYEAHVSFVEQLLRAVRGESVPGRGTLADSKVCPLTPLLEGDRMASLRDTVAYRDLLHAHATVHQAAGAWLACVQQGRTTDALPAMERFYAAQETLFSQLHGLYLTPPQGRNRGVWQ